MIVVGTDALSQATAPTRSRRFARDPGVVLRDLAVSIADGGDCVSDLEVLAGHEQLFGKVASESTAHRVIGSIGFGQLERFRADGPFIEAMLQTVRLNPLRMNPTGAMRHTTCAQAFGLALAGEHTPKYSWRNFP